MLWWIATDSESRPDVGLGVKNPDVVQVAFLEGSSLVLSSSLEHVLLVEPETSVHDEVRTNQNGAVAFPRARSRTASLWLGPGHNLEVKDVNIVEEVVAIPAAKHNHLGSSDQVGSMIEPGRRSTTTLWALIPSHSDRIESMQVSEHVTLALASEYDDPRTSEDRGVAITTRRRSAVYLGLDPSGGVDIKHVGVVQILEARLLSFVKVASKDH